MSILLWYMRTSLRFCFPCHLLDLGLQCLRIFVPHRRIVYCMVRVLLEVSDRLKRIWTQLNVPSPCTQLMDAFCCAATAKISDTDDTFTDLSETSYIPFYVLAPLAWAYQPGWPPDADLLRTQLSTRLYLQQRIITPSHLRTVDLSCEIRNTWYWSRRPLSFYWASGGMHTRPVSVSDQGTAHLFMARIDVLESVLQLFQRRVKCKSCACMVPHSRSQLPFRRLVIPPTIEAFHRVSTSHSSKIFIL